MGDFREHLQSELVRKCKANPRYSLRAFARQLQVESSALSKILNGKRGVSPRMLVKLGKRLGLGPAELATFRPSRRRNDPAAPPARDFQRLTLDTFQLISQWYHYAILELTHVSHFKPDPRWIARTLGLTVSEVNIATQRLQRLDFLKIEGGRWTDCSGAITTVGNEFTAQAFRLLQKQVLEKALDALEEIPWELRDQSSITTVGSSRLVGEAKVRIKKFRRELGAFLKSEEPLDSVYHLGICLYPLNAEIQSKGKKR